VRSGIKDKVLQQPNTQEEAGGGTRAKTVGRKEEEEKANAS